MFLYMCSLLHGYCDDHYHTHANRACKPNDNYRIGAKKWSGFGLTNRTGSAGPVGSEGDVPPPAEGGSVWHFLIQLVFFINFLAPYLRSLILLHATNYQ